MSGASGAARGSGAVGVPGRTRLDGRQALVTGAGRGLGRAIAIALAEAGADVALLSRSATELEEVAARVREAGTAAQVAVCDVRDPGAFELAVDGLKQIDVLVNNAGTNEPQPFVEVPAESFDRIMDVNLRALFFASQAAARRMVAAGEGSIVNISSQMGHVGAAGRSVYCASKHAVEGLTRALAVELGPAGVRVNAVAPTYVETPLTADLLADPSFRDEVVREIPLRRVGRMEEVAAAAVFLASPAASLVTGASLVVDGGYTAH